MIPFSVFQLLVLLVALEHAFICVLEMFFSRSVLAIKIFELNVLFIQNPEYKKMMGNQGLYNGFLSAGLFLSIFFLTGSNQTLMILFFLICVIIASIYGGFTVKKSIILTQGLLAIMAIIIRLFFTQ